MVAVNRNLFAHRLQAKRLVTSLWLNQSFKPVEAEVIYGLKPGNNDVYINRAGYMAVFGVDPVTTNDKVRKNVSVWLKLDPK